MNKSADDARIGLVLNGRYRITERLAEGGMGVVYKGERIKLGRPVAIKFLHEPLNKDEQFRIRFEVEARAMSQLSHPNCVSVIDFGYEDAPYIVMDYVTGKTLRQLMDEKRVPPGRSMHIAKQLLASMAHAHKHGIIHRDIKPANVMLSEATGMGDHVRIFDFGLAKLLDPVSGKEISGANVVVGTPNYMSPEQSLGQCVDARSDIYSTAVLIFELLAGRKPFVDESSYQVVMMHRETPPPTLTAASEGLEFSPELEAAVAKALEKDPDNRFQTAADFSKALSSTPEALLPAMVIDEEPTGGFSASDSQEVSHSSVAYAKTEEVSAIESTETPSGFSSSRSFSRFRRVGPLSSRRAKAVAFAIPIISIVAAAVWLGLRQGSATSGDYDTNSRGVEAARSASLVFAPVPGTDPPIAKPGEKTETEKDNDTARSETKNDTDPPADLGADGVVRDTAETRPDPTKKTKRPTLKEIEAMIASKKYDEAIQELRILRRESPDKALYPYMQAEIFFERKWYKDALEHYSEAIRLNPGLRGRRTMNNNLISLLGTEKIYRKARWILIKEIGRPALPFLRHAAKAHPDQLTQKRAQNIARAIAGSR